MSKDLNLPLLTYNSLLESRYFSQATPSLLIFSTLPHMFRPIAGYLPHFSSRKINMEADFFFPPSSETVF